jgi:hypothetical protein
MGAICHESDSHLLGILPIVDSAGGKAITVVDRRLLTYRLSDDHVLSYNTLILALSILRPALHALT